MARSVTLVVLLLAPLAWGRPVSFVGSTMGMAGAQPWASLVSVDHTFARRFSAGLQYQWLRRTAGELDFIAPELNVLVFRHNADDWQANVFFTGALGAAVEARRPTLGALGVVEADAESRRVMALVSGRLLQTSSGQRDWQLLARAGFAPVLAEADQLSPWLLVQYQYMPGFSEPHVVSPVVRLLYQGFLVEAGVSLRGDFFFNVAAEVP